MNNRYSLAQQVLAVGHGSPTGRHDPSRCEVCAMNFRRYPEVAAKALEELARGYLEASDEAANARRAVNDSHRFVWELHAEGDALAIELDSRSARVEELSALLEKRNHELETALSDNASSQPVIDELRAALTRESERQSQVAAEERERIERAHASEIESLRGELNANKAAAASADVVAAQLRDELTKMSARHADEKVSLQDTIARASARVDQLESELRDNLKLREAERTWLETEITAGMSRLEVMQRDVNAGRELAASLRGELDARALMLESLQRQVARGPAVRDVSLNASHGPDTEAVSVQRLSGFDRLRIDSRSQDETHDADGAPRRGWLR